MLGNGRHVLDNGPHVLGNGSHVLGNEKKSINMIRSRKFFKGKVLQGFLKLKIWNYKK